jgi:3-isopropylmalate/(R)-2-methylmalate dehydratase small subunit
MSTSIDTTASTLLRGRVWKFGDNVSGDDGIIDFSKVPDLGAVDTEALRAMCFERIRPAFRAEVRAGDIVVGGRNFAIQNHMQAGVAIKASGVVCVVVESCDMGFLRKSLNIGLPVVVCAGVSDIAEDGALLEVDPATGLVSARPSGRTLHARPYSPEMLAIWRAGGLANCARERFARGTSA